MSSESRGKTSLERNNTGFEVWEKLERFMTLYFPVLDCSSSKDFAEFNSFNSSSSILILQLKSKLYYSSFDRVKMWLCIIITADPEMTWTKWPIFETIWTRTPEWPNKLRNQDLDLTGSKQTWTRNDQPEPDPSICLLAIIYHRYCFNSWF